MTPEQLKKLTPAHPDYDPDTQSVRCDNCFHLFLLYWDAEEYRLKVGRPVGRIVEEKACPECAPRLAEWNARRQGPGSRAQPKPRRRPDTDGLRIEGVNA